MILLAVTGSLIEKNAAANVIVRFVCRKKARECLAKRGKIYGLNDYPNLDVKENLYPKYQAFYDYCKDLKEKKIIKELWTYNGTIFHKKSNDIHEKGKKVLHNSDIEFS